MDEITTVESRVEHIIAKYNIPENIANNKREASKKLKKYFDKKCGCDIYSFFELSFC